METLVISLDKQIADDAYAYAKEKGESLSSLVEAYLKQLVSHNKDPHEAVPDVVMSLLGAALPVADDDSGGRNHT